MISSYLKVYLSLLLTCKVFFESTGTRVLKCELSYNFLLSNLLNGKTTAMVNSQRKLSGQGRRKETSNCLWQEQSSMPDCIHANCRRENQDQNCSAVVMHALWKATRYIALFIYIRNVCAAYLQLKTHPLKSTAI